MWWIPLFWRYLVNSAEISCGPLSVVIVFGKPQRENRESRKLIMTWYVTEPVAMSSGHFECRSWTTTRKRWWWGTPCISPQMSSCRWSQGCDGQARGCKGGAAWWPVLPLKRQAAQSFTRASMSLSIPGDQTRSLQRCFNFTIPRWPSPKHGARRVLGMTVQRPRATQVSFQQDSSCFIL